MAAILATVAIWRSRGSSSKQERFSLRCLFYLPKGMDTRYISVHLIGLIFLVKRLRLMKENLALLNHHRNLSFHVRMLFCLKSENHDTQKRSNTLSKSIFISVANSSLKRRTTRLKFSQTDVFKTGFLLQVLLLNHYKNTVLTCLKTQGWKQEL